MNILSLDGVVYELLLVEKELYTSKPGNPGNHTIGFSHAEQESGKPETRIFYYKAIQLGGELYGLKKLS